MAKCFEIVEPQRSMMSFSGTWMVETGSLVYRSKEVLSHILGATLTCTMLLECYKGFADFERLSKILYITMTMVAFVMKLSSLKIHRKYFWALLKQINGPIFNDNSREEERCIKNAIMLSKIICTTYKYVCVGCAVTYGIFPYLDHQPLSFPFPYFHSGPMHYPMYIFQFVSISFSAWNNACIDVLFTGFMLVAAAQLEILKIKLEEILNRTIPGEEQLNEISTRTLKNLYLHHLEIIGFIKNVENLFSFGLLAQLVASIFGICNTGFQFMLTDYKSIQFINLVFYLTAMLSQLTMYCWFGNEIILKSLEIGDVCYMSKWYRLAPKSNKYIFLIMERSKRPLFISAYGFVNLSLGSLTSIMQWSYSSFTLLRRLYADKNMA